ncbi:hypothetical protein CRUP_000113 [Coryphaenoides rupestris]|nr:hypothetical protein CRUP_000113 [Coryphaenoides rupestris]
MTRCEFKSVQFTFHSFHLEDHHDYLTDHGERQLRASPWRGSPARSARRPSTPGLYGNFKAQLRFISDFSISLQGSTSPSQNTTWSPATTPALPQFGGHTGSRFGIGDSLAFSCNTGYRLQGAREVVCLGGGRRMWSAPLPSVIPHELCNTSSGSWLIVRLIPSLLLLRWFPPPPPPAAECGSTVSDSEGVLLSPNYPMYYDDSHECVYSIRVQTGKGVNVTASAFQLAQGDVLKVKKNKKRTTRHPDEEGNEGNTLNANPFLSSGVALARPNNVVYDGKDSAAHLMGTYTGTSMQGLSLTTTSNRLWLEFFSDREATGEGFRLQYYTECGGSFKGISTGRILSPGYPFPYDNNLRCTWTIGVDSGNIVSLQFLAFDTEASHDILKVWDGPPDNEMSLKEVSGSLIPDGIHSTLNLPLHSCGSLATACRDPGMPMNGSRNGEGREPGDSGASAAAPWAPAAAALRYGSPRCTYTDNYRVWGNHPGTRQLS